MPPLQIAEGKTVPEMFQSRAQLSGDEVALRYKKLGIWHDVSWKEYGRRVKEVSMALLALGLKAQECVSIIGENSPEWVYIDLGTMHAGGTTVGVYATNSWEQCQYVVDHSESASISSKMKNSWIKPFASGLRPPGWKRSSSGT
jgi:long-chain acyl-CoA synthetase